MKQNPNPNGQGLGVGFHPIRKNPKMRFFGWCIGGSYVTPTIFLSCSYLEGLHIRARGHQSHGHLHCVGYCHTSYFHNKFAIRGEGGVCVGKYLNLAYMDEISNNWLAFIDINKCWIFLELDYRIYHLNVQAPFVQNKSDIL